MILRFIEQFQRHIAIFINELFLSLIQIVQNLRCPRVLIHVLLIVIESPLLLVQGKSSHFFILSFVSMAHSNSDCLHSLTKDSNKTTSSRSQSFDINASSEKSGRPRAISSSSNDSFALTGTEPQSYASDSHRLGKLTHHQTQVNISSD